MASVIIDTASWIQLAKPKYNNLLTQLEQLVEEGSLQILKNDIIDDEWNRNKDRTLRDITSSIKEYAKSAVKMKELLPDSEGAALEQIITKYQTKEAEQVALAESHYNRVNKLINEAKDVGISDELKLRMVDRSLKKKAPFHNSRNNMADALIIFSAIEWVNEHKLVQHALLFISGNHKEFADPTNLSEVHPEILEEAKDADVYFTSDIARLLHLKEEHVDDTDTYVEDQLWSHFEWEAELRRGK